MSVFLSNVALYKWEEQDRTKASNYDYQDKYQVDSRERNQTLYKKKWLAIWGIFAGLLWVCQYLNVWNRWLFISPLLYRIGKLFSSRQSRPWFAPSYLRISTIANQSTPNQLATLPSIWHFSGLQLAQNWHQNTRDLRWNVTQYYNCMMHVLAKIKSHETRYVGLHFRVCLHKWRWIGRGPKGHQEPTALQWPNPKPTLSVRTGITYGCLFSYA